MIVHRRAAAAVALLLGAGAVLSIDVDSQGGAAFLSSAQAQPIRNLIARLRGETLPDGVVKSNGRIEASSNIKRAPPG
jgi:HlyD family secretion protein